MTLKEGMFPNPPDSTIDLHNLLIGKKKIYIEKRGTEKAAKSTHEVQLSANNPNKNREANSKNKELLTNP